MKILNVFLFFLAVQNVFSKFNKDDLLVVTFDRQPTDVHQRFLRSLKIYGFKHQSFPIEENSEIRTLQKNLESFKDDKNKIILFTNSSDVVFDQGVEFLLGKFESFGSTKIVVSSDDFCFPEEFENKFPSVNDNEKRFLNGALFIGFAQSLYELFSSNDENLDDLQLFFVKKFLDENERTKWSISIDKRADIFLNLYGSMNELELPVHADEVYVKNTRTDSIPTVIHGNGPSKKDLNYLGNYIARTWSVKEGCLQAKEDRFDLIEIEDFNKWPMIYFAVFIEFPTPFLREFFQKLTRITYPKNRIAILIHNEVEFHRDFVEENIKRFQKDEYIFVKTLSSSKGAQAREEAVRECQKDRCDYLFSVDSISHIDHPDTLIELVSINRTVVAPMLLRPGQAWSNFWGDINEEGFYKRSPDYLDFINYKKMGLFNVPHVANCYLMNGRFLQRLTPSFVDDKFDYDIRFSQSIRESGYLLFISNDLNYGHLIDPENYNTSLVEPELYEIFNNVKDWKARYLHPDYQKAVERDDMIEQPCPDVYWFPMVSEEFTRSLVHVVEANGEWSGSSHHDRRLAGGYENVPTDDIHMTQVDFQEHWLFLLRDVVQPIQQKVFTGYYSDPPKAILNFVVRYMPDRQNKLRPHHDASTYTLNLALNDAGIDFEGGGCRFVRQNCSILNTRRGWALLQPGRLTHLHEGLPVTKGTRYIMVSFIDP